MSIFGGEAIIQPQAEMEAEQEEAPRHRMSVLCAASLSPVPRRRWLGPGPMSGERQVTPVSSLSGTGESGGQT